MDLVLLFKIINNELKIELPYYISKFESQDVLKVTRSSQPIKDSVDILKYRCKFQSKIKCFKTATILCKDFE